MSLSPSTVSPPNRFEKVLAQLVYRIDNFTLLTGRVIAWFSLFMVVIMFAIVVLRYVFNTGWIAMQESVLYFHGLMFMLGCAYTLKQDAHVRVDIFYTRFSPVKKAWVNLLGTLLLLFPVVIFIAFSAFDYVARSWSIMESSAEAGGLPFVYLSKSFILLFCASMMLQGISEVARHLLTILKPEQHAGNS